MTEVRKIFHSCDGVSVHVVSDEHSKRLAIISPDWSCSVLLEGWEMEELAGMLVSISKGDAK